MRAPAVSRGVICVCSRGLIHSRTAEALSHLQRVYSWPILFTHSLSIPDAQNSIVERALARDGCEWLLFIEEDIVPPEDLIACATSDDPVQTVDYALPGGTRSTYCDGNGRIVFCGMGCLFVAAEVFRKIRTPWFFTDAFGIERNGKDERLTPDFEKKSYGGQDISLCYRLQQANIPVIRLLGVDVEHLRVKQMGASHSNSGCHQIERL